MTLQGWYASINPVAQMQMLVKGAEMEPTLENPESGVPSATPKRSRVKAAVAAIVVAGALTAFGVASVFAASPSPTASGSPSTTGHTCPAHTSTSSSTN
jgi:hypothetical protein